MVEQSHVSMETHICVVCGKEYDTGSILFDKGLRPKLNNKTLTGNGLCKEDQAKYDDDFIALIEIDPAQSKINSGASTVTSGDAYRTGTVVHLKKKVYEELFVNHPSAHKAITPDMPPMAFVDREVIEKLQGMIRPKPH